MNIFFPEKEIVPILDDEVEKDKEEDEEMDKDEELLK